MEEQVDGVCEKLLERGCLLYTSGDLLGWIMDLLFRFTNMFGIVNIGLCIILFTLVTKVLMIPLTIKQQKSSKLMAVMQPEIAAIQKKYKGCLLYTSRCV